MTMISFSNWGIFKTRYYSTTHRRKRKLTLTDTNEQHLLNEKHVECYDKDSFNSVISEWLALTLG